MITDQEHKVVTMLAEVWNEFLKLPVEHPNDQQEFGAAVHACQDKILGRIGRRAYNARPPVLKEGPIT